ncbi:MAG: MOSC domain-containing protein [Acidimicrobiales bacterium]|nr:MOSC domain-containing protein [Acidimicrobiales bacterium]
MVSDACDGCRFCPDDYTERDLRTSPRWLTTMLEDMLAPVDPTALAHPAVDEQVSGLQTTIDGIDADPAETARVHFGVHGLRDLSRTLHHIGAGAETQQGTVAQLSTSDGGVPKSAVASVEVGPRGFVGDRQGDRKHHGRPFQAVCLWSSEVIDALAAEGHPIGPGLAGENLTVSGIDWATLRPGVRLLVGDVTLEVSGWAEPCRKNDRWFIDRSDRMDHRLHPGWSRAYAWVIEPGTIAAGDDVIVEP